MLNIIHILNLLLPVLYLITVSAYYVDFIRKTAKLQNLKRYSLLITVALHLIYLLLRTIEFDHLPMTNKFEVFSLLALNIALCYVILEIWSDVRETGLFILTIPVIFQFLSSAFIKDLVDVPTVLNNKLLGIHVVSALLGYSGFAVSAVYGVLYYILYKELKLNKFGLVFNRLPSLEHLEKLSYYSVICGFIFLTFAMIIGIVWLPQAFPNFSYLDPKLISTTVFWIIFGVGIMAKAVGNWYGKKVIKFYLIGFVVAMLSMFFANVLVKSFHVFY
ncbi:MAG: cytochrome c biogenesis protein [Bacteroidetes bacterium]|jgi:ABC-type uncharacterized transport system permease subunit|nr:cytochrome c biogenesis protein [Bacteroidota bacterium]